MVATTAPQVRRPFPSWLSSAIGGLVLLAIWQIVGATMFKASGSVPVWTAGGKWRTAAS